MREVLGVIGEQRERFLGIEPKMPDQSQQEHLKQRIRIANFLLDIDILDINLS